MSVRFSHLMKLAMSVMCVVRFTSLLIRCEHEPSPVMVGVNTLWPFFSNRSDTRRQHQPPCQAPCTSTKVLRVLVCALADALPSAATPAPAPPLANPPRRVIEGPFASPMGCPCLHFPTVYISPL